MTNSHTLPDTLLHLWAAVEANPADEGLRVVLATAYQDADRWEEAEAVLATAKKWPEYYDGDEVDETPVGWDFYLVNEHDVRSEGDGEFIRWELLKEMTGRKPFNVSGYPDWVTNPTFTAAMLDLIAAWVAVHKGAK